MNKRDSDLYTGYSRGYLWFIIVIMLLVLLAVMFFARMYLFRNHEQAVPQSQSEPEIVSQPALPAGTQPVETLPAVEEFRYPVGKLMISDRRKAYVSGDMILEIPRLNLICNVLDGTDQATLNMGVGLFEYAQLPGVANSNTSIVAHRDIYGKEFYYIHTITDGDLIYLTYEGIKYTYQYLETIITESSNWDSIRAREYTCITLQSCDPIGTSLNRIFVVGEFIDMEDVA